MNLYIAALHSNGYKHTARYQKLNDREKQAVNEAPHLLESYHYINRPQYVQAIREHNDTVFLDSGAFSAYTLGVEMDIVKYCDYIKENIDIVRKEDGVLLASVLDGIGDPQKTYNNQQTMEYYGAKPLPCFHYGEDERYLEYYIANYEYITLGGMVPISNKQLVNWLDRIWNKYLLDGKGKAKLKVHGFGMTSIPLMKRYPWWSCDSSSWIQSASFGSVMTPDYGPVRLSDKSPSRHTRGQHTESFTDIEKESILNYFDSQHFEYERLQTVYESRAAYNVWSYCKVNQIIDAHEIEVPQIQELF